MARQTADAAYLTQSASARRLGVSNATLCELSKSHPLYEPTFRGFPGGQGVGTNIVRYHVEQLRIIEALLVGNLDLGTAWLEWQVIKRRIGQPAVRQRAEVT